MNKALAAGAIWLSLSGGACAARHVADDQAKKADRTDQTICYPLDDQHPNMIDNMRRHGWDVDYSLGAWFVQGVKWVAAPTEDSPVTLCVPEWHGVADDQKVTR